MVRSWREMALQALWYEIGALAIVTPSYAMIFGRSAAESLALMLAISVVCLPLTPLHNAVFDRIEWRKTRRLASDRPAGMRVVHAITHETSSILATVPLIVWIGGHGLVEAIAVDIGLTLYFAAYALVFFFVYDRLRPVAMPVPVSRPGSVSRA